MAFDLLSDIYTVPIAGGEAKALTHDVAWQMQPRYSPDGKTIAFTADQGGGDNIWIMNRDGSNQRAVTKESFQRERYRPSRQKPASAAGHRVATEPFGRS